MRAAPGDGGSLRRRRYCSPSSSSSRSAAPSMSHHQRGNYARPLQPRKHDDATWRQMVNAPVVEAALEKLVSNVVQEVRDPVRSRKGNEGRCCGCGGTSG